MMMMMMVVRIENNSSPYILVSVCRNARCAWPEKCATFIFMTTFTDGPILIILSLTNSEINCGT